MVRKQGHRPAANRSRAGDRLILIRRLVMRFSMQLLVIPLLIAAPAHAGLGAQDASSQRPDSGSLTIRWNRLVPRFGAEASVARRAARATATAAGDSARLRRIAMTPPPILFRVYTLLSVAQYGAVNAARDERAVSPEVAIASASAAILSQLYTDSTVRASIARELARDVERAGSPATERAIAGRRLGEDVARRVLAWAPTANLVAPWNGTIPMGPGMWYSAR